MLRKLKGFFTKKYLFLLKDIHNQKAVDLDTEYLRSLLKVLEPEKFKNVTLNLNSENVDISSIHKNFEEFLRFLILINSALSKSNLIYRDGIFLEEKNMI